MILRNAYGPLPGCRLFLKPAEAPAAAWQEMDLREELIESDGEIRPRHPGEPAPEQAAPWSATYELGRLDPGTRRLALKIQSEDQDLHGVLDDWTLIDEPP